MNALVRFGSAAAFAISAVSKIIAVVFQTHKNTDNSLIQIFLYEGFLAEP